MVAVFMPVLKCTLGAASPDHQSHDDFPALIHDVSAIFEGGFRFSTIFDSISLPGSSAIMNTRHGLENGVAVSTATPCGSRSPASLRWGERSAASVKPPKCGCLRRYMPE